MTPESKKVFRKAVFGYVLLWVFLVAILGLAGFAIFSLFYRVNVVTVRVIIGCAFAIFFLGKSLFVRPVRPKGLEIYRREAPELFSEMDRFCALLKVPKIHHVLVTSEFNAGIVQYAVLGPLGFYKNYLLIGYPLLALFPKEEFLSILAHEIGHLSELHGKSSAWVYRTLGSWERLRQEPKVKESYFGRFTDRFVTKLHEQAMPVMRQHEYEADEASVAMVGANVTLSALHRMEVIVPALSSIYWPSIYLQAAQLHSAQHVQPFARLQADSLSALVSVDLASHWIESALARQATALDTHPCFRDRIAAVSDSDFAFKWTKSSGTAALSLFDGQLRLRAAQYADSGWQENMEESWKEHHESFGPKNARLEELRAKETSSALTEVEWDELFSLLITLKSPAEVLQKLDSLPEDHILPVRDRKAHRAYALVKTGDVAALDLILDVVKEFPETAPAFCRTAEILFVQANRCADWELVNRAATEFETKTVQAQHERENVGEDDTFTNAPLLPEWDEFFTEKFRTLEMVKRAWVLEKQTVHYPGSSPVFLVAVEPSFRFRLLHGAGHSTNAMALVARKKLMEHLPLPPEFFFYVVRGKNDLLSKKITALEAFYRR
jgi:Zn-dependent protease with chaperone function